MTPEPPPLPQGHRHLWTPERATARGYWLAMDHRGYEYAVGCSNHRNGKTEVSTSTAPDGTQRSWRREDGGQWAEATPSTCASRWLDRCPPKLRCAGPWALPNGQDCGAVASVRQTVGKWANDHERGQDALLLWGPPGTGKSQTAVWVGLLLAGQGIDGEWLHLPTGAQAMRASYGGDREAFAAQMARWLSAPFLVCDDMGAEIGGKDVAELVYRIADSRYNSALATVWTTNLAPMMLTQSGIDPRTVSRIAAGHQVELGGKDRRGR